MSEPKRKLMGMDRAEMQTVAKEMGMPGFAARQIMEWVYVKRVRTIDGMTNLSLKHREALSRLYKVGISDPVEGIHSVDGTIKYLFKIREGQFVEAVYIPDDDRATLCVSSQVGCKMHCAFCMTGRQGFSAHLTAGVGAGAVADKALVCGTEIDGNNVAVVYGALPGRDAVDDLIV